MAQTVKNPPVVQEIWVWFLGWEDLLEKGMVIHSSILAWKNPQTEEPGRLQAMESQRVRNDSATNTYPWHYQISEVHSNTHFPERINISLFTKMLFAPLELGYIDLVHYLLRLFKMDKQQGRTVAQGTLQLCGARMGGEFGGNGCMYMCDYSLQHSCLENPMDRGAWQATVHGVTESRTRLSD